MAEFGLHRQGRQDGSPDCTHLRGCAEQIAEFLLGKMGAREDEVMPRSAAG